MVVLGDTFIIPSLGEGGISYLCIVLSDPTRNREKLVIVNFTRWDEGKDDSCVIEAEEHPWLKHTSCIDYRGLPFDLSAQDLEQRLEAGDFKGDQPVSKDLLAKILAGAADTRFMAMERQVILVEQGLIR